MLHVVRLWAILTGSRYQMPCILGIISEFFKLGKLILESVKYSLVLIVGSVPPTILGLSFLRNGASENILIPGRHIL